MTDVLNKLAYIGWEFWVPTALAALWAVLLVGAVILLITGGSLINLLTIALAVYFLPLDVYEAIDAWNDYE